MSNEEKILQMLSEMKADIKNLQTDVETLKGRSFSVKEKKPRLSAKEQLAVLDAMRNLLNDEEKAALGRYQAAEEARKTALYG